MPRIGKMIGLIGDVNGLDLLSKTSPVMIEFFNKQTLYERLRQWDDPRTYSLTVSPVNFSCDR